MQSAMSSLAKPCIREEREKVSTNLLAWDTASYQLLDIVGKKLGHKDLYLCTSACLLQRTCDALSTTMTRTKYLGLRCRSKVADQGFSDWSNFV